MANIKKLKANGQDIVPITHEQAVLDSNGVTLDSKLNAINNAISRLENNSTSGTPSNPSLGDNTTIITMGNYTIKYNETDDTLDFIYNGATDVPVVPPTTEEEIIPLTWAVGNLSGSNGSETEQANSLRSSFAAIEDNYDYSFYLDTSFYDPSGVRVYFYDTNKTYISRTDGNVIGYVSGTDISIDVPTNAAYMRFKANASGTTSVDTIGSLFTLRKRKAGRYVTEGLSLYIDAQDVTTQGSIRDIAGNYTVTNHGVNTTSDNKYLNFVSSESDYLDTNLVPNLTKWSAELYFYFTETPTSSQTILGWGANGNKMRIAYSGSNGVLGVQSNNNYFYTIDGASDLISPHHLIITMNNGAMTSYLDGVKNIVCTSGDVQTSHTNTLKIGTKYDVSGEFTNMNLKMFRFYDGKVLTDEEALQNYNYETNRNDGIIKPTWKTNTKLDTNTGLEAAADKNACTDFISYDNSYEYTLAIDTVEFFRVYYYDSSQSYIKNDSIANNFNGMINPPENTAYMRLKLNIGTAEFADLDNHVIFRKTHK